MPTFPTPDPIWAAVEILSGDVRITAADRAETVVDVRPADPSDDHDVKTAEATHVECANGHLVVKTPQARSWLPRRGGGSIAVSIEMPTGSHLYGTAQSGDFQASGRIGDCRIKTGRGHVRLDEVAALSVKSAMGDVTVDHVTGDMQITLASGDVRVGEVDGAGIVKNASGDISVGVAHRDLNVKNASGDIAVDVADAAVAVKTAKGSIRTGDVARGSVVLETHQGDVEVGIRGGTAAWLDVNTSLGSVINELAASPAPGATEDKVEVRARTSVGDVLIRRP